VESLIGSLAVEGKARIDHGAKRPVDEARKQLKAQSIVPTLTGLLAAAAYTRPCSDGRHLCGVVIAVVGWGAPERDEHSVFAVRTARPSLATDP
jgi:hypothetical protein